MKTWPLALMAATLACSGAALAEKPGKQAAPSAAEYAPGKGEHGQPTFSDRERDEINRYFQANPGARSQLPPGLAKKNKVPPGWQKKLARGQRISDDVWANRVPLPREIAIKLPPLPDGVIRVRIEDRVVKVAERTREVLDVLGLPAP